MKFLIYSISIALMFILTACESGAPSLDENDEVTLTISANPSVINNMGDSSQVSVRAIRADGRPVFDGTPVSLTTTGGKLPDQVTLVGGVGEVLFQSGTDIGPVTITAQSGSVGADRSISTTIMVEDGQTVIGNLTLVVNPNNLSIAGGPVSINLVITDTFGSPIPDERVLLSSDRGIFESSGNFRFSDRNGVVSDTLRIDRLEDPPEKVTVTLQVRDQLLSRDITITSNQNPVPVILTSNDMVEVLRTVYFDGGASNDPDGAIEDEAFEWKFGDGGSATGPSVDHIYIEDGVYTVILKVTDNLGASQNTTRQITVLPQNPNTPPNASFSFSPVAPRTGKPTFFNALDSADPDGEIKFYRWDFGDGLPVLAGATTSHTYLDAGEYRVILEVEDDRRATAVFQQDVMVTGNLRPTANFTPQPANVKPGEEVTFDASGSFDPDGSLVHYQFDFGDGGQGGSENPFIRHTYAVAGSYEVFLTVTDDNNALAFFSESVSVSENQPPRASFNFAPEQGVVGSPILFNASDSISPDGTIVNYSWSFGDGSQGVGREVAHAYETAGNYEVRLAVFDSHNASDQSVQIVQIGLAPAPVPDLTISQTALNSLILDASGTTDPIDTLEELVFGLEALAPPGVNLSIPNDGTPVQEVGVESDMTAFQLYFILSVKNSAGLTSHLTETWNYVTDPLTGKRTLQKD